MQWSELPWIRISIGSGVTDANGTNGVSFVLGVLTEVARVERIIDELFVWHDVDLKTNADLLVDGRAQFLDQPRFERFSDRELARMGGIVSFLCVLHGVLRKEHENLLGHLRAADSAAAARIDDLQAAAVKRIHAELMRAPRLFRNKVFAHTSYSKPDDDNWSTQLTSLMMLSGACYILPNGIGIGAMSIHAGDEPIEMPPLSVEILRAKVGEVLAAWHEALRVLLGELCAVSDEAWVRRFGVFAGPVIRSPA